MKETLIALTIASIVFGVTALISYEIAAEIHTSGTDILKKFI